MNKELLFKVVEEVIDRGGSLSIHLTQLDMGKEWPWEKITESYASQLAEQFKEAVKSENIERDNDRKLEHISTFTVDIGKIRGCFSFYNNLVEDVDLSGSEEPLPFADLDEIMKEDMRSEEYVSSFDLYKGEGL